MAVYAKDFLKSLKTIDNVIKEGVAKVDKHELDVVPFYSVLSPVFGNLNGESIKTLDDGLQVIVAGCTNALAKKAHGAKEQELHKLLGWEGLNSTLSQTSILEPVLDANVSRSDKLIKDDVSFFKFGWTPNPEAIKEAYNWFVKFIGDEDVLADINIDIDVFAKLVAQTGANITNFWDAIAKKEHYEQTVLDIGILRYPDESHPYFKSCRIKVVSWAESKRMGFVQRDASGMAAEFESQSYQPRESIIKQLSSASLEKAKEEVLDLFSF